MGRTSTRVKCPLCGWQVSQLRFSRDYPLLEMASFTSEGRGKFIWLKNVEIKGRRLLLVVLKSKLERLLAAVNQEMTSGLGKMAPSVGETNVSLSTPTRMETSMSKSIKTEAVMSVPSLML